MTEREVWHPVPGHESGYEITRSGRVRSIARYVNSPAAGGQRRISCRELKLQMVKGYPAFQARNRIGQKCTVYVHRALAMLFVPNPSGKPDVNHIDGNKANHDPANLEWVTHRENMRHAHAAGLMPPSSIGPGEGCPAAKLTWPDVERIRLLLGEGQTHAAIAHQFGVKKGAIGCIARNETWKAAP